MDRFQAREHMKAPSMTAKTGKTIYIVDDDEVVRDSLKVLLEARHFKVEEFASGPEYLKQRRAPTNGCLVLDIHMPEMSGLELLQMLRQHRDATPVILITGRRDRTIETQAKELGVLALLDKPIPHTSFFQAIEQALAP